ncbi:MAG: NADH:ubiquinone reductase (Na(+)-transporting) subunit D [Bacillota bacterium]|jgi:Na+-transporting NADH:ubiquinone oxidoreductase subunit D|nr:NADH:ubiquinone reductase (Na(+)-transporting) subunit D [Bacillota bacterium]HHT90068.1 NADH:ubiquinone reductase (Na(+)-transporting) subunit D [Bacillota bacterium]
MIKKAEVKALFKRNLWDENQVLRQILGICSLLAVTNLLSNSLVMGVGLIFSVALSSFTISLLRNYIPHRVRMIIQTLIIAAWVILFDIVIKAMLPDISRALGPYVGLIITNCIIMGRAEAFAQSNPPVESFLDGVFAGLGYTAVLIVIAFIRELMGFGTILGFNVNFLGLQTWTIMVMPPAAFFLVGVMIWIVNNIASGKKAVGGGKNG